MTLQSQSPGGNNKIALSIIETAFYPFSKRANTMIHRASSQVWLYAKLDASPSQTLILYSLLINSVIIFD